MEFPDLFEFLNVVELFDQPFANPTSYLMHQLSQKAREHITVALCGAGGDELFAGYPRSSAVRVAAASGGSPGHCCASVQLQRRCCAIPIKHRTFDEHENFSAALIPISLFSMPIGLIF